MCFIYIGIDIADIPLLPLLIYVEALVIPDQLYYSCCTAMTAVGKYFNGVSNIPYAHVETRISIV